MKELVVVSGKGGTGKTTITASLAALASEPVVADCDVDAPNLHLLLNPKVQDTEEFIAANVAVIDPTLCRACGACELNCRFGAIGSDFVVDPIMCEGCGVCEVSCPYNAIQMKERLSGYIYSSKTRFGPMAHALLLAGESNSGKMVTRVRELARDLAKTTEKELILVDGPPGIACATIAAITGSNAGLVVTEPTVPAIHDLKRVLRLFQHFTIPVMVVINKADLNLRRSKEIESFCKKIDIPVVGQLLYDPIMYKAVVGGRPIIEHAPNHKLSTHLQNLWVIIEQQLNQFAQTP
ncbi:MAG: ATP-binding protein [Candidatus Hermodarchaeia archaeon]|jgi:MinD superfamily P-loop ATPase